MSQQRPLWFDDWENASPFIKALDEVRRLSTREGWYYKHVQAIQVAIDQYAEAALGNREFFLNKPHSIGGSRKAGALGQRQRDVVHQVGHNIVGLGLHHDHGRWVRGHVLLRQLLFQNLDNVAVHRSGGIAHLDDLELLKLIGKVVVGAYRDADALGVFPDDDCIEDRQPSRVTQNPVSANPESRASGFDAFASPRNDNQA